MTVTEFYSDDRLDEAEREQWIARWEYDQNLCPQCGMHRDLCGEPRNFYPQRTICYATAAQRVAQRRYEELPENQQNPHGMEGDLIWVSTENLTPDDDFLRDSPQPDEEV